MVESGNGLDRTYAIYCITCIKLQILCKEEAPSDGKEFSSTRVHRNVFFPTGNNNHFLCIVLENKVERDKTFVKYTSIHLQNKDILGHRFQILHLAHLQENLWILKHSQAPRLPPSSDSTIFVDIWTNFEHAVFSTARYITVEN